MTELDAYSSVSSFVLILAGVAFIYYLSKLSQYNEASELRATRRIEDVAFYLSKIEEHVEDSEMQLHKKIDASEVETRIRLTTYDKLIGKAVEAKKSKRRIKAVV